MLAPGLPELAKQREVIAVDLYGHGRTALTDRPIDYVAIGDDLAILLKQLGYEKVDVLGYSMGGGIAFRLAVQHPTMVRRLVLVSTSYAQDGFYPEMLPMQAQVGASMADQMKTMPIYESYARIAPRPQDFPKLLDRMGEWMRRPYDWSADVKKLDMPVMLIYGDSDMFRPEHEVGFYHLLGGGLKDAGWLPTPPGWKPGLSGAREGHIIVPVGAPAIELGGGRDRRGVHCSAESLAVRADGVRDARGTVHSDR